MARGGGGMRTGDPAAREEIVHLGRAVVRETFKISRVGNVAGCYVTDGTLVRSGLIRILREGEKLAETRCAGLRRFQEDVREVQSGYECGVSLEGFDAIKEGDVLEFYHRERVS